VTGTILLIFLVQPFCFKYGWTAEGNQLYCGVQTAEGHLQLHLTDIITLDAVFLQGKKEIPKEDLYFRYLIEDV